MGAAPFFQPATEPMNQGFTDSDLAAFAHETQRRGERIRRPARAHDIAWQLRRAPPNPRDKAASALALAWCAGFAEGLRPKALCERFPRLANRLALCWPDPLLSAAVLDELLTDRRGDRSGFPAEVQAELVRLLDSAQRAQRAR